jgi:gas vesicle protein
MVVATEARCLTSGSFNTGFQSFIQTCISSADTARSLHVINTDDIKTIFQNEQDTATDLITSFQGIQTILGTTNVNQSKLDDLTNTLDTINKKIEDTNSEIEVENQKFISSVTDAPKKSDYLGNLQDIALGLFFFSLFLITIILTVIQYARPGGSLKLAGYTLLGMLVAILVIYGLLKEIA